MVEEEADRRGQEEAIKEHLKDCLSAQTQWSNDRVVAFRLLLYVSIVMSIKIQKEHKKNIK